MRPSPSADRYHVRTALLGLTAVALLAVAAAMAPMGSSAADQSRSARVLEPVQEVWQVAEPAYAENPRNPLANRLWGVYQGPQDQVYAPYVAATGERRAALATIAERPRTKWFGAWVSDKAIRAQVQKHIAVAQA